MSQATQPDELGRTVVMQPYVFPYLGYFQLFHACDRFVLLDDVAFIRQGWINRNRILVNGAPHLFTIPVSGQSSFITIHDTQLAPDTGWKRKLLRTIDQAYRKAPCHAAAMPLVEQVITTMEGSIADGAALSLRAVLEYLGLDRPMQRSSEMQLPVDLRAQERVIAICKEVGTSTYINASGGRPLYQAEAFAAHGMELRFLGMGEVTYVQGNSEFQPALSIVDVLMWKTRDQVRELLTRYSLEQ